jgi:hypothetical protein
MVLFCASELYLIYINLTINNGRAINVLQPGSVTKIQESNCKSAFVKMANIEAFLNACTKGFHMRTEELFRTIDLIECRDLFSVTTTLLSLGRKVCFH